MDRQPPGQAPPDPYPCAACTHGPRESNLLALVLYHGLTTGCGAQTLGEEYCSIQKVTAGWGGGVLGKSYCRGCHPGVSI